MRIVNHARKQIYLTSFLVLSALPLVWYCGTTWDSDSDDLITTLISIENWRFLFWGASRFGTFVPLLAKPFSDMQSNLLFQNFIHAFSLLVFVYALSRVFYQKDSKAVSRTFVFMLLIVLFLMTNSDYLDLLISGLPYAAPLGIFGLSLLIANTNLMRRIVLPLLIVLIAISCWINPLNGYYLAPLLVLLMSLKKFKNVFYELALSYLLVNFGIFFIILGLANGERGGTVPPNFVPFKIYAWWLPLIIIQVLLLVRLLTRRKFKKNQITFLSFLLTWTSIFALTSLRHISLNSGATRYFITATFVSMCITMRLLEEVVFESKFLESKIFKTVNFISKKQVLTGTFLALLLVNVLISRNLTSDYPLRQPQKDLIGGLFPEGPQPYKFASGDFWYTWPTKLYVNQPENIFITSWESEYQYDTATDSKKAIQSRFKSGDLGLCFGEVEKCKDEIREAAYRMYGSFRVEVEISDLTLITKDPILVHKLRISITSK